MFDAAHQHYRNKGVAVAKHTYPIIENVFQQQGQTIENIVVPFSDGLRQMQVMVNLKKAYQSQGAELIAALERNITLAVIDDEWKEHLRAMDDLKQSVQNAVYEQKDPLLIYKFESFKLFQQVLESINKDILSFVFKGFIPMQNPEQVREAKPLPKADNTKLKHMPMPMLCRHRSLQYVKHTSTALCK
jgi:preprotein translocase subunit SecA